MTRFLKEIGTDHLDLVLLHCVSSPKWTDELRQRMDGLAKLKEKGIIRAHGVSCHSLAALEAAAAEPWVDSVHTRINPFGMSMDDKPEKVVPVLKKLHADYFLRMNTAFSISESNSAEFSKFLGQTLDAIYLNVSDILDIHMYTFSVELEVYPDRSALADELQKYMDRKSFHIECR